MKKCIIIPDSFKGTISAIEYCNIGKEQVERVFPGCEVVAVPVADGGEGTVDCFLYALGCEKVNLQVQGPFGEVVDAYYARRGDTAIMEMAMCAGLPRVEGRENPSTASAYGVGQMICHAVENGCKEILLGLGGSCTNEGGASMAAGCGAIFKDAEGKEFIPTGGTLGKVASIDVSAVKELLKGVSVTAMCDVNNPMYGPRGAAHIFGPQKGADEKMVEFLDENMIAFSKTIEKDLGISVAEVPGSGAAGAMGAGVIAFLGGQLKPGIQAVLDLVNFEQMLEGADLVITGEGRIDGQSLGGKVVIGIAGRAKAKGVPVAAVVGDASEGSEGAYELGVTSIFPTNRKAIPFSEARKTAKQALAATLFDVFQLWKAAEKA